VGLSEWGWVRLPRRRDLPAVVVAGMFLALPGAATWRIQSIPNPPGTTASVLAGVSCAAANACVAVGGFYPDSGNSQTLTVAEGWNGRTWTLQPTPAPAGTQASWLTDVSCAAVNACIAVGYLIHSAGYVTLAERWNGRNWAVQSTPNPKGAQVSVLDGVSCVSVSVCTAVGDYVDAAGHSFALAERWDGHSWTLQSAADPGSDDSLGGVSCTSASTCTAVGQYYNHAIVQVTLAERWNGSNWTVQPTPNPWIRPPVTANSPTLTGVSCPTAAECIAIGTYYRGSGDVMLAERWNGNRWAIQPTPNPAKENFPGGLVCTSASACVAVGMYYTSHFFTYAERWDGSRWALQSTPDPAAATDSGLYDVSCTAVNACTAVGNFIDRAGAHAHLTLAERYS
jgi:hypothetical protein